MISATSNKNLFLVYALLDCYGFGRGSVDSHYLRRKTFDHFSNYRGLPLNQDEYRHHSKLAAYVLTIGNPPEFEPFEILLRNESTEYAAKTGSMIRPHLKHFYDNTDFELFYSQILPLWNEEIFFVDSMVKRAKLDELLDEVWQVKNTMETKVILMPLEDLHSGVGCQFNNVAYPIIGPPFNSDSLLLVAHEGSHPRAKSLLSNLDNEINSKSYLFDEIKRTQGFQSQYNNWNVYFEEHLLRAVQHALIDPVLSPENFNTDKFLDYEERVKGMIYIRKFYDVILNNKRGDLRDIVVKILDEL